MLTPEHQEKERTPALEAQVEGLMAGGLSEAESRELVYGLEPSPEPIIEARAVSVSTTPTVPAPAPPVDENHPEPHRHGSRRIGIAAGLACLLLGMAVFVATPSAVNIRAFASSGIDGVFEKVSNLSGSEERFLILGDEDRRTEAARQRAIWEREPDNAVYYANYITTLFQETNPGRRSDAAVALEELRYASTVDNENARYHYLRAGMMTAMSSTRNHRTMATVIGAHRDLNLRMYVPEAMSSLRKAQSRRVYSTHAAERHRELFVLAGTNVESAHAAVSKAVIVNEPINQDLIYCAWALQGAAAYADYLLEIGDEESALSLLDAWRIAYDQLRGHCLNDGAYIHLLTVVASGADAAEEVCRENGLVTEADSIRDDLERLVSVAHRHREKVAELARLWENRTPSVEQ